MDSQKVELSPPLIGREDELETLDSILNYCEQGSGATVFVSGEAGIGKTMFVEEFLSKARSQGINIIRGRCIAESLEPFSPIKEALRGSDLFHIISDKPPPKVLSAYLTDKADILIAKAERKETELDADIFAGMIKSVSNFVSDSLSMMGEGENEGVSGITYKGYQILMDTKDDLSLILVIEGDESEFLIDDMHEKLNELYEMSESIGSKDYNISELNREISWFIESGKYEGKYLVDDSKLKRDNLFDHVLLGLRREASKTPIVMFIDDLQWADPSTLSLIHYISRNIINDPIILFGAYRPEDLVRKWNGEVHQLKSMLRNMDHEGLFVPVELNRLKKTDVITLLKNIFGEIDQPAKFYDRAFRECDGNPFFLMEFLMHMIEDGHIVKTADGWTVERSFEDVKVPSKIYNLVERRLDNLMEVQRNILEFASVMGDEFRSSIIGSVLRYERNDLLKELDDIEKIHGLIKSSKIGYKFDHKKVRETLYTSLNHELKEEYHLMLAEFYEKRYQEGEEDSFGKIVHHYYKAKNEKGVNFLVEAGCSAQERHANEEADRFFTNALELIPDSDEDGVRYIHDKLGDVHKLKGDYESALDHYKMAIDGESEKDKIASIYGKISELYANMGDYEEALDSVESGMKLQPSDVCSLLKTKGWVLLRKGDYYDAEQVFMEERRRAGKKGDDGDLAQSLHDLGALYFRKGDLEEALHHFKSAEKLWKKIGDLRGLSTSFNNIGIIYYYRSDFEKSLEYHKNSLDIKERIEDKRGIAISLNNIGAIYKNKGEFQKAVRCYEQSLEILEKVGDRRGVATSLKNIGNIHYYMRDYTNALEFYRRALRVGESLDDEKLTLHVRCAINEVLLAKGDVKTALEHGKQVQKRSQEIGSAGEEGMARRILGAVYRKDGELDSAERELLKARELLDISGNQMEFTKVLYELGLLYYERGEMEKFQGHIKGALNNFKDLGVVWWADMVKKTMLEMQ